MISFLLPTHDRPSSLRRTMEALGSLSRDAVEVMGGAEVIIVDCASVPAAQCPECLDNGWPVHRLRLEENNPAAGRNRGATLAQGEWIIMLDDDSYPIDGGFIDALREAMSDTVAIGAEILLPDDSHEAGGLPEVFIGCGVAIRREAYLAVGGYDESFVFYAEEYDLAAKFLKAGGRIRHDFRFRVRHHKEAIGRDMNRILEYLVRNNIRLMQRYAPETMRQRLIDDTIERYGRIADKEGARKGFQNGLAQAEEELPNQPHQEMGESLFNRWIGYEAALSSLSRSLPFIPGGGLALVEEGKHAHVIRQVLADLDVPLIDDSALASSVLIGTLSPGPMIDAARRQEAMGRNVVLPWIPGHLGCECFAGDRCGTM